MRKYTQSRFQKYQYLFYFVSIFFFLYEMAEPSDAPFSREEDYFIYGNFKRSVDDLAFQKSGTAIYQKILQDKIDCLFECLSINECLSVNMGSLEKNRIKCELLDYGKSDFEQYLTRKERFYNLRLQTACYSNPCQNGGLCTPNRENGHIYQCNCSKNYAGTDCQYGCIIFDYEHGLTGWTRTGTAFNNQPTYGDNSKARAPDQPSQHAGNWWIGSYENRPSSTHPVGPIQGDAPTGTLTSPTFVIRGSRLSFLIGGGCDINIVRAELVIDGAVISKTTGRCSESMEKKHWDVSAYKGRAAQLRLVDSGSGGWQHINFDHLEDGLCSEGN